jgi:methylenetetrahydrofolate reductase (NADH)
MGFVPVPHLAARRLGSVAGLAALREATDQLFVVGGDPVVARGPFPDALALIRSGLLARQGFRAIGLPGYPSGLRSSPNRFCGPIWWPRRMHFGRRGWPGA